MAPQVEPQDVDWIVSNTSSAHVANDLCWFKTYTPFPSSATTIYASSEEPFRVEGVGDVELNVKIHPTRTGSKSHRPLILRDVLYIKSSVSNIFATRLFPNAIIEWGHECRMKDGITNKTEALFVQHKLLKLWLSGQRKDKSSLDPEAMYLINVDWPESERAKWSAFQRAQAESESTSRSNVSDNLPYSPAEKLWLKQNFGGEFQFLLAYQLSIYKEEDREEGRTIARALISDYDGQEEGDGEEENDFLADLEADPTSHVADRLFSGEELDFIEKHYRHSGNFLLTHGLKPFDDEDCHEGKAILRQLMNRPTSS